MATTPHHPQEPQDPQSEANSSQDNKQAKNGSPKHPFASSNNEGPQGISMRTIMLCIAVFLIFNSVIFLLPQFLLNASTHDLELETLLKQQQEQLQTTPQMPRSNQIIPDLATPPATPPAQENAAQTLLMHPDAISDMRDALKMRLYLDSDSLSSNINHRELMSMGFSGIELEYVTQCLSIDLKLREETLKNLEVLRSSSSSTSFKNALFNQKQNLSAKLDELSNMESYFDAGKQGLAAPTDHPQDRVEHLQKFAHEIKAKWEAFNKLWGILEHPQDDSLKEFKELNDEIYQHDIQAIKELDMLTKNE